MTAILHEIRRLEAAHARGDMTADELEDAKDRLVDTVEEADLQPTDNATSAPIPRRALFDLILLAMLAAGACMVIATYVFGDLTLALTLTVTLMAAIAVRAFLALDD